MNKINKIKALAMMGLACVSACGVSFGAEDPTETLFREILDTSMALSNTLTVGTASVMINGTVDDEAYPLEEIDKAAKAAGYNEFLVPFTTLKQRIDGGGAAVRLQLAEVTAERDNARAEIERARAEANRLQAEVNALQEELQKVDTLQGAPAQGTGYAPRKRGEATAAVESRPTTTVSAPAAAPASTGYVPRKRGEATAAVESQPTATVSAPAAAPASTGYVPRKKAVPQ